MLSTCTDSISLDFHLRYCQLFLPFFKNLDEVLYMDMIAEDLQQAAVCLLADSYDNQSDEVRAAHMAVPIQCALTLAGSLESVVITVNVRT